MSFGARSLSMPIAEKGSVAAAELTDADLDEVTGGANMK
jgi:hypothetical protein